VWGRFRDGQLFGLSAAPASQRRAGGSWRCESVREEHSCLTTGLHRTGEPVCGEAASAGYGLDASKAETRTKMPLLPGAREPFLLGPRVGGVGASVPHSWLQGLTNPHGALLGSERGEPVGSAVAPVLSGVLLSGPRRGAEGPGARTAGSPVPAALPWNPSFLPPGLISRPPHQGHRCIPCEKPEGCLRPEIPIWSDAALPSLGRICLFWKSSGPSSARLFP